MAVLMSLAKFSASLYLIPGGEDAGVLAGREEQAGRGRVDAALAGAASAAKRCCSLPHTFGLSQS